MICAAACELEAEAEAEVVVSVLVALIALVALYTGGKVYIHPVEPANRTEHMAMKAPMGKTRLGPYHPTQIPDGKEDAIRPPPSMEPANPTIAADAPSCVDKKTGPSTLRPCTIAEIKKNSINTRGNKSATPYSIFTGEGSFVVSFVVVEC